MVVAHQLSVKGYIRDTHTFHWQGLNVTGHLQTDTPPPYEDVCCSTARCGLKYMSMANAELHEQSPAVCSFTHVGREAELVMNTSADTLPLKTSINTCLLHIVF